LRILASKALLKQRTAEYVYTLIRASAVEPLARKYAARIPTMEAAHKNAIGLIELREMLRRASCS
jgi:F0F1-type ATP synthase gamma subunit